MIKINALRVELIKFLIFLLENVTVLSKQINKANALNANKTLYSILQLLLAIVF